VNVLILVSMGLFVFGDNQLCIIDAKLSRSECCVS